MCLYLAYIYMYDKVKLALRRGFVCKLCNLVKQILSTIDQSARNTQTARTQ